MERNWNKQCIYLRKLRMCIFISCMWVRISKVRVVFQYVSFAPRRRHLLHAAWACGAGISAGAQGSPFPQPGGPRGGRHVGDLWATEGERCGHSSLFPLSEYKLGSGDSGGGKGCCHWWIISEIGAFTSLFALKSSLVAFHFLHGPHEPELRLGASPAWLPCVLVMAQVPGAPALFAESVWERGVRVDVLVPRGNAEGRGPWGLWC